MSTPDIGKLASALLECSESWLPDARLLGNVTAREISEVACFALAAWEAGSTVNNETPLAQEALRIVHAFPDAYRKEVIRDLARRIAKLEREASK